MAAACSIEAKVVAVLGMEAYRCILPELRVSSTTVNLLSTTETWLLRRQIDVCQSVMPKLSHHDGVSINGILADPTGVVQQDAPSQEIAAVLTAEQSSHNTQVQAVALMGQSAFAACMAAAAVHVAAAVVAAAVTHLQPDPAVTRQLMLED